MIFQFKKVNWKENPCTYMNRQDKLYWENPTPLYERVVNWFCGQTRAQKIKEAWNYGCGEVREAFSRSQKRMFTAMTEPLVKSQEANDLSAKHAKKFMDNLRLG